MTAPQRERDAPARRREGERVVAEILQRSAQLSLPGGDVQLLPRELQRKALAAELDVRPVALVKAAQEGRERQLFLSGGALGAGKILQQAEPVLYGPHALRERVEAGGGLGVELHAAAAHEVGVAPDGGERVLDVVHQRRQQLAPFAEQSLQRAGLARHLLAQVLVQAAVFPHQQHPAVHHQRRKAGDQRKGPVLFRPGPELGLQIACRQRRDRKGKP